MFALAIKQYLGKHGFEALRPKAVLFDMDGVLYDSMENHAIAWHESMATFGIDMTTRDAYATEGARGIDTIREMVRKQQGRDITLDEAQQMYELKSSIFHSLPETPVMPGILTLMQQISDYGLSIGVVTGSGQRPLIARLLDDFGQFLDPSHITTAYDVNRGKPHPDPYLKGMAKAGVKPWETFIVENAPLGVKAGTASRAFTMAVNTGPLTDQELYEAGADLLFSRMTELSDSWPTLMSDVRPLNLTIR